MHFIIDPKVTKCLGYFYLLQLEELPDFGNLTQMVYYLLAAKRMWSEELVSTVPRDSTNTQSASSVLVTSRERLRTFATRFETAY